MTSTDTVRLEAPAKINLTLEILGLRKDGYHAISSVMQTVSLTDTLTFRTRDDGEIVLECDDPVLAENPEANLVWRAARILQQVRSVPLGAGIRLEKRIPQAAGLGGGSSNAAAALRGLNDLWHLKLTPAEMQKVASLLGSDVPFFIGGGTALAEGRGEEITPLRPLAGGWFVLVTPDFFVAEKTRVVYALLRPYEHTNGVLTGHLVQTLAAGRIPPTTMLYNGLEDAIFRAFHDLDSIRQDIVAAGGESVRLTGAGPSLYTFHEHEAEARALYDALATINLPVHLVRPVPAADQLVV